jgi:hypothetical protein
VTPPGRRIEEGSRNSTCTPTDDSDHRGTPVPLPLKHIQAQRERGSVRRDTRVGGEAEKKGARMVYVWCLCADIPGCTEVCVRDCAIAVGDEYVAPVATQSQPYAHNTAHKTGQSNSTNST